MSRGALIDAVSANDLTSDSWGFQYCGSSGSVHGCRRSTLPLAKLVNEIKARV